MALEKLSAKDIQKAIEFAGVLVRQYKIFDLENLTVDVCASVILSIHANADYLDSSRKAEKLNPHASNLYKWERLFRALKQEGSGHALDLKQRFS